MKKSFATTLRWRLLSVAAEMILVGAIPIVLACWGAVQPAAAQNIQNPAGVGEPVILSGKAASEHTARRVVIRFLTDSDFPPFNFYDEEGALVGFNVDLARAICLELNTSCDIKSRSWNDLIPGLKSGEADAVIAAHKVTAAAMADVDFSDRYFHTPARFAGHKDDEEELEISPAGLYGKHIAVARGTAHEAYLKSFFRDSPLVIFENADLAREAAASGKADYVFDDGISLAFWINGTLSRQCCEMKGGPFLEPKFFGEGLAIALPKGDLELKALINEALRKVRASGRFEELVQRYFPVRIY